MAPQSAQPDFSAAAALTDGQMVVTVRGALDMVTISKLDAAIDAALRSHAYGLVIDLSATTFMDSTGCQSLVRARNLARKSGVELRLRGITSAGRRTLERLKLDKVFTFTPDKPHDDG